MPPRSGTTSPTEAGVVASLARRSKQGEPGQEEEHEEGEQQEDRKRDATEERALRRKRSRVALCDESGMTEHDRRVVRHKLRLLHDEIESGLAANQEHSDDKHNHNRSSNHHHHPTALAFLAGARAKNNELFHSVRYTREAVLDADNSSLLLTKTVNEFDKLVQVCR